MYKESEDVEVNKGVVQRRLPKSNTTVASPTSLSYEAQVTKSNVTGGSTSKPKETDSKDNTPKVSEPLPPFRASKLVIPLVLIVIVFMIPVFVTMSRFKLPPQHFNIDLYNRINKFWFADLPAIPNAAGFKAANKNWYGLGASDEEKRAFDQICKDTSHAALESIGPSQYTLPLADGTYQTELSLASSIARPFVEQLESAAESQGVANISMIALSMILLLDQMPRNVYRDPQNVVYNHYDRISRSLLRHILSSPERLDRHPHVRNSFAERTFFYLPLIHSEFMEDHDLWDKLVAEDMKKETKEAGDQASSDFLDTSIKFSEAHHVIIKKFGRYPYRNKWMDRETTKEEREWIENGGETFGSQ